MNLKIRVLLVFAVIMFIPTAIANSIPTKYKSSTDVNKTLEMFGSTSITTIIVQPTLTSAIEHDNPSPSSSISCIYGSKIHNFLLTLLILPLGIIVLLS
jgi:hypothetical protein